MMENPNSDKINNHNSANIYANSQFSPLKQQEDIQHNVDSHSVKYDDQNLRMTINLTNDDADAMKNSLYQNQKQDLQNDISLDERLGSLKIINDDNDIKDNQNNNLHQEFSKSNNIQIQEDDQSKLLRELENMSIEDMRQMIIDRRNNIQAREQQIRDMQNMLKETNNQQKKVSQINMANEYELQDCYGKLEKRQEAMRDLLQMKEELFTRLQKVQTEVDDLLK